MSSYDNSRSTTRERSSAARYLITIANMDVCGPLLGAEPAATSIIVEATSQEDAEAFAREFALDCAAERMAWLEQADGLTLEEAQEVLARNGLYVADPVVELLSDVDVCTTASASRLEQEARGADTLNLVFNQEMGSTSTPGSPLPTLKRSTLQSKGNA